MKEERERERERRETNESIYQLGERERELVFEGALSGGCTALFVIIITNLVIDIA
jgi:hypothetical protein